METISNLNLILSYLSLRFYKAKPNVMHATIKYMNALFNMLFLRNYRLSDYEADSLIK